VVVADEDRGIILPDVGQPSPIELYEASIIEQRCAEETGIGVRPIERHPDGQKKDGSDGRDADFGRSLMERDSFDAERLREESEERQRRLATEAPPIYLSGMQKPKGSSDVDVYLGFRGNWHLKTVNVNISEEEVNQCAGELFSAVVATPDFRRRPFQNQQFRCFRDLSRGEDGMWITLRARGPSRTLTMRVALGTSQDSIENAALEELEVPVIFANKFPSVLESNGTYQLKKLVVDSDAPEPPSDFEEPVGLKAIEHRPIMFTRSGSVDDLRGISLKADVAPKSDLSATSIVKFGNKVTQIQAQVPKSIGG
jgi:hypothetical protein